MATSTTTIPTTTDEQSQPNLSIDRSKWKEHDTPQDCGFVSTLAVTLFLGWNGILIFIVVYLALLGSVREYMIFIGICTLSLVFPPHYPPCLGSRIGSWMVINAEKYFGKKLCCVSSNALNTALVITERILPLPSKRPEDCYWRRTTTYRHIKAKQSGNLCLWASRFNTLWSICIQSNFTKTPW